MLLIPIRTDSPIRRIPWVNYSLLAVNVLIFMGTDFFAELGGRGMGERFKNFMMLDPQEPRLYQFFTYQFVHGDWLHIFGNMLFLWVFGNSVNYKMGHVVYLLFYLAAGVFAGVGFVLTGDYPCLGASGAIAGVTTAYLVLFPRSEVAMFYWFWFYIGQLHIQALWLISLKIILFDNIIMPNLHTDPGYTQVAYSAHIAGYIFGFVICMFMLLVRALPRDQYDILALVKRAYQRQALRAAMANPEAQARATFGRVARPITNPAAVDESELPTATDDATRLRGEIAHLLSNREYTAAASTYEGLLALDPQAVLSRKQMFEVANQLMVMKRHEQAAAAYERFLKAYPTDPETLQVRLVLGIIYAKYLQQYALAEKHLRECTGRLTNADQLQQAMHWLEASAEAMRQGPSGAHG